MKKILGLDIGSVSLSAVVMDSDQNILNTFYCYHHGDIRQTLHQFLNRINLEEISGIAKTSSTPDILNETYHYNDQVSFLSAAKKFHPEAGSILIIGGEKFGLIRLSEKGEYENYISNNFCAAGTGGFLEQQARRLNLESVEQLALKANENQGKIPKIATRCAVFAKTDLIHSQQEGYDLSQICDGLCEGMVKNISDTLFPEGGLREPLVIAGGVSQNKAIIKHFTALLKSPPLVDEYAHLYGALGAALCHLKNNEALPLVEKNPEALLKELITEKSYPNPPLNLKLSHYPDFTSLERYTHTSPLMKNNPVEVDLYEKLKPLNSISMGLDIGSTSTKAALIDREKKFIAGFYTRTAGQPLTAVQMIFEAIENLAESKKIQFHFTSVGTTGSGRKLIGKVIGADIIVDEITAQARAACEIDPEVDTIIEIGGQDSKFTTLTNGMVSQSIMNNVCAAGTGSFIEELAQKFHVSLNEYSRKTEGISAPMTSNRCTVFMERDLNHLINQGYSTEEVLASILHSVRDNYLKKVAVEASIGKTILFQGATAKNKSLIAAFEQGLKKPLLVSKFCHLTGAYGTALILKDRPVKKTHFRGTAICREPIEVETEVCPLCTNHCKITQITVQNEKIACGFLCGRDYNTTHYVDQHKNKFNLIKEYQACFKMPPAPSAYISDLTVGIPSTLYLYEEQKFWKHFFNTLKIRTCDSERSQAAIKGERKISRVEFCMPMNLFYNHVKHLSEKSDYVFLPVSIYSKDKENHANQYYCYYSQYAPSLVTLVKETNLKDRSIIPLIEPTPFLTKIELYKALQGLFNINYWTLSYAYDQALQFQEDCNSKARTIYNRMKNKTGEVDVVLLGRPYFILDKAMNKNIPDLFSRLSIQTFFQDMLDYSDSDLQEIKPLLTSFHWIYASKILSAAIYTAKAKGLYPVYITSFKCAPDSFVLEYFKRIMEKYGKPYLILEIDEHSSNIGYETRIEAAVRSFQNHFREIENQKRIKPSFNINPRLENEIINQKTLLIPSWDDITVKLLEAIWIKNGYDARMVPLTRESLLNGPKTNTGQCLPINMIYQSILDYIDKNGLDTSKTKVWMLDSILACNVHMFPSLLQSMFEKTGRGFEKVDIYKGTLSLMDISMASGIDAYFAYQFGGLLRKMACVKRPYEKEKGKTNKIVNRARSLFYDAFLGKTSKYDAVVEVVSLFNGIETEKKHRPKIAIFGDIYVRDNETMNQNLIECIENAGGEALTTPFDEMVNMVADHNIKRWLNSGYYKASLMTKGVLLMTKQLEKKYYHLFNQVLNEHRTNLPVDMKDILKTFNLKTAHSGESMDNLIKIYCLIKKHPEISLFVQASPAFCCAGLVTEAMALQIEDSTGIPVISITYDGTENNQNNKIATHILSTLFK